MDEEKIAILQRRIHEVASRLNPNNSEFSRTPTPILPDDDTDFVTEFTRFRRHTNTQRPRVSIRRKGRTFTAKFVLVTKDTTKLCINTMKKTNEDLKKKITVPLHISSKGFRQCIEEAFPTLKEEYELCRSGPATSKWSLQPFPAHVDTPRKIKEWKGLKRSCIYVRPLKKGEEHEEGGDAGAHTEANEPSPVNPHTFIKKPMENQDKVEKVDVSSQDTADVISNEVGVPNRGNTCFLSAGVQVLKATGLIQDYVEQVDGHRVATLDMIFQITESLKKEYSHSTRAESVEGLVEIFPEFNDGMQHDIVDFIRATVNSTCELCMDDCTFIRECLVIETRNSMKCDTCLSAWSGGLCTYPVLPLHPISSSCFVGDCLDGFFESKTVDDGLCAACGKLGTIQLEVEVVRKPPIVLVQIIRWQGNSGKKNQSEVEIDSSIVIGDTQYEIRAVMCHEGSNIEFGHYKCLFKESSSGKWFAADDSKLSSLDERAALRNFQTEVCGVVYRKVVPAPDDNSSENSEDDCDEPLTTRRINTDEMFPSIVSHLDAIMAGNITNQRHADFINGKRERKGYLFGLNVVSIRLKETMLRKLDAHYSHNATPSAVGTKNHKGLFTYKQQVHYNFPVELKGNMKKLGYYEVESAYLREVLLKEALVFVGMKALSLSEVQTRSLFKSKGIV